MRRLALLPALTLVVALAPLTGGAGPIARAVTSAPAGFVDLGIVPESTDGVSYAGVTDLNDAGDAFVYYPGGALDYAGNNTVGVWHAGTISAPGDPGPAGCGAQMNPSDIAPDGTVVGVIYEGNADGTQCAGTVGHATGITWKPGGSATPTIWPEIAAEDRPNCGYLDERPTVVDDEGEVGGAGEFNARGVVNGCAETIDDEGLLAPEDGSTITPLAGLDTITSMSKGWAVGIGAGGSETLVNRGSGATTNVDALVDVLNGNGQHMLSAAGVLVGSAGSSYPQHAAYSVQGGPAQALSLPADAKTTSPSGATEENEAGQIIGDYTSSVSGTTPLYWASPTSDPVDLEQAAELPAGWYLDDVTSISPDGLLGGYANDANDVTHNVEFKAGRTQDLTSAITVTDPNGNPFTGNATAVGKSLLARVTLTASTDAGAPITGITASPVLAVAPGAKLTQTTTPQQPADGYTLAPGQSVSYTVAFTITGTGSVTFSMSASGTEGPYTEPTTDQKVVHLGQPLQVDVAWQNTDGSPLVLKTPGQPDQPNTVKLADNDAGEIPQDVVAVVTLTNISNETQTSVTVNGVPALSYHTASQATQSLPIGVTVGPLPTGTPADMAPGDVRQVTYRLHVTNNGVFDFSPQVLSSDADDLNSISAGVGTITALPTALLWLAVKQRDTRSIRAGDVRYLTGTVTNRSLTQSVDVVPIEPKEVDGNGGGGGMTDDTKAPLADGTVPPFSGILKPGQTADLSGELDTAPIPATRAVLTYAPAGAVVNADSTETDLTGSQVGMSSGSSPINVAIQDTDPDVPPITVEAAFNSFTDGAVQGAGTWAVGHIQAAATLLAHPINGAAGAVSGFAKLVVHTPRDLVSAAYIVGMSEVYGTAYLALTPAQRQSFENQILSDYDQSYVKADNAEASKAVDAGFSSFSNAMQTGDFRSVANLAGSGLATGGGVVADAVLSDVFFQQLGIGLKGVAKGAARGRLANALVLADEALQKKLPAAAYREITAVKAGQNLLLKGGEALENVFGLTQDQITKLRKFCQENKIIVAVRARSKRAADLIKRGLAVGKNEVLKLKGVNEIDVDYLGYSKADLNTLVFAEPVPESAVIAELDRRGVTGNQREVVLDRYKQRKAEWTDPKVAGVMDNAAAKGEIEWGFNGTDNGAKGADRSAQRRFALHDKKGARMLDGKTPRKYQTVYVSNVEGTVGGRLVRVTQDTDMLAILSENGEILSAALRTKVYEYLSDALGIEHPETVSWLKGGDILFLAKIKELLRTAKGGGEALGVFGPDGSVRAGFLNPALTVYDVAEKTGVIFFEGGYNNPYAKAATKLLVTLKRFGG